MKNLIIFVLMIFIRCSQEKEINFDFLVGTWQVENKQTFEEWSKNSDTEYNGKGYKIIDDNEMISEYLSIKKIDGEWVYSAQVTNQNQGKAIPFTLNSSLKDKYSFENSTHDFPNKIQYEVIDDKSLKAHVLNNANQGFIISFKRK